MAAEEALREGRLDDALAELQAEVRKDPASSKHRVFLFQLLCVMGQWDRALNQLDVAGEMDSGTLPMVQTYRSAVQCERFRADVFGGRRSPLFFGEPEEWMALLVQALEAEASGSPDKAVEIRDRAFEAAPATSGRIGEQTFSWIADADPRLGPMMEVVLNGNYFWIPFHRIHSIEMEAPEDLRDLVFTPAIFTWANGGNAVGMIPTRYPGTESVEDGHVRLSRRTEWEEVDGLYIGRGQRMLATDEGEFPLLEVRQIELDVEMEESEETPEGDSGGDPN